MTPKNITIDGIEYDLVPKCYPDKENKRDWEITAYQYINKIYNKNSIGEFSCDITSPIHELILHPENMNCIHSVRRISDGVVFSVGDEVVETVTDYKGTWKISEFSLKDTRCFTCGVNINNISKLPERTKQTGSISQQISWMDERLAYIEKILKIDQ